MLRVAVAVRAAAVRMYGGAVTPLVVATATAATAAAVASATERHACACRRVPTSGVGACVRHASSSSTQPPVLPSLPPATSSNNHTSSSSSSASREADDELRGALVAALFHSGRNFAEPELLHAALLTCHDRAAFDALFAAFLGARSACAYTIRAAEAQLLIAAAGRWGAWDAALATYDAVLHGPGDAMVAAQGACVPLLARAAETPAHGVQLLSRLDAWRGGRQRARSLLDGATFPAALALATEHGNERLARALIEAGVAALPREAHGSLGSWFAAHVVAPAVAAATAAAQAPAPATRSLWRQLLPTASSRVADAVTAGRHPLLDATGSLRLGPASLVATAAAAAAVDTDLAALLPPDTPPAIAHPVRAAAVLHAVTSAPPERGCDALLAAWPADADFSAGPGALLVLQAAGVALAGGGDGGDVMVAAVEVARRAAACVPGAPPLDVPTSLTFGVGALAAVTRAAAAQQADAAMALLRAHASFYAAAAARRQWCAAADTHLLLASAAAAAASLPALAGECAAVLATAVPAAAYQPPVQTYSATALSTTAAAATSPTSGAYYGVYGDESLALLAGALTGVGGPSHGSAAFPPLIPASPAAGAPLPGAQVLEVFDSTVLEPYCDPALTLRARRRLLDAGIAPGIGAEVLPWPHPVLTSPRNVYTAVASPSLTAAAARARAAGTRLPPADTLTSWADWLPGSANDEAALQRLYDSVTRSSSSGSVDGYVMQAAALRAWLPCARSPRAWSLVLASADALGGAVPPPAVDAGAVADLWDAIVAAALRADAVCPAADALLHSCAAGAAVQLDTAAAVLSALSEAVSLRRGDAAAAAAAAGDALPRLACVAAAMVPHLLPPPRALIIGAAHAGTAACLGVDRVSIAPLHVAAALPPPPPLSSTPSNATLPPHVLTSLEAAARACAAAHQPLAAVALYTAAVRGAPPGGGLAPAPGTLEAVLRSCERIGAGVEAVALLRTSPSASPQAVAAAMSACTRLFVDARRAAHGVHGRLRSALVDAGAPPASTPAGTPAATAARLLAASLAVAPPAPAAVGALPLPIDIAASAPPSHLLTAAAAAAADAQPPCVPFDVVVGVAVGGGRLAWGAEPAAPAPSDTVGALVTSRLGALWLQGDRLQAEFTGADADGCRAAVALAHGATGVALHTQVAGAAAALPSPAAAGAAAAATGAIDGGTLQCALATQRVLEAWAEAAVADAVALLPHLSFAAAAREPHVSIAALQLAAASHAWEAAMRVMQEHAAARAEAGEAPAPAVVAAFVRAAAADVTAAALDWDAWLRFVADGREVAGTAATLAQRTAAAADRPATPFATDSGSDDATAQEGARRAAEAAVAARVTAALAPFTPRGAAARLLPAAGTGAGAGVSDGGDEPLAGRLSFRTLPFPDCLTVIARRMQAGDGAQSYYLMAAALAGYKSLAAADGGPPPELTNAVLAALDRRLRYDRMPAVFQHLRDIGVLPL